MAVRLIEPDIRYRESYLEALNEGLDSNSDRTSEKEIQLIKADFDGWVKWCNDINRPVILPDGQKVPRVPGKDFWLVDGNKFLGRLSLRLKLNEHLLARGGNIGYSVRKSERRKGYGALMLKLVLPEARKAGLDKALITCNDENIGSQKIIEGAGGVLQDKAKMKVGGIDILERRYWLTLAGPAAVSSPARPTP
jgi:predicted acetyltransferase